MATSPCLNPNCKSNGRPHPNCQCYANMANGGKVSHFCEQMQPHGPDCMYFAEGGTPAFDPKAFLQETGQIPDNIPTPKSGFDPQAFLDQPEPDIEEQARALTKHDEELQNKYGGAGQQAIAGLEAAGRTLTFGGSSLLEKKLGVPVEDIQGREEANPITSTVGSVAGLLSPVGEGAVLAKAGQAAAKGLEKAAPRLVEKGILAGASKGAVKLATENALFQAGDETSKMILEDPHQTLGTAITNIGLAGAIGAVGGGGLGAVGALWKAKMGPKASEILSDFRERIKEHLDISEEAPKITPHIPAAPMQETKQVYDPFTKEPKEIPISASPTETKANFDPFTKKPIEVPENSVKLRNPSQEPLPTKDLGATPGGKLADMYVKHSDQIANKGIAGSLGAMLGHATGIPYGGAIGAVLGDKLLTPILEKIMPTIVRPILDKAIAGDGFKSAIEYGSNVIKGQRLIDTAIKAITKPGIEVLSLNKYPDRVTREKLDTALQKIQHDPARLTAMNEDLSHYYPDHTAAAGTLTYNISNFLNSLRPQSVKKAPLDTVKPVSTAVQAQYDRALDIAQQPLIVLGAIKQGTLTSHDIIALQTMYPALYQGLKQRLLSSIVAHTASEQAVPYNTRTGLSLFLGQPLDSTMSPEAITLAQPTPAQAPQQPQGGKKISNSAASNTLKGVKSSQTPLQASESMHSTGKS